MINQDIFRCDWAPRNWAFGKLITFTQGGGIVAAFGIFLHHLASNIVGGNPRVFGFAGNKAPRPCAAQY